MPSIRMTELAVRSLKPVEKQVEYYDATFNPGVAGSLGLRVNRQGQKSWFVSYRLKDDLRQIKQKFKFGGFPDLNLKSAREKAGNLLSEVSGGVNLKARQQIARQEPTFADLCELYMIKHALLKKAASSAKGDRQAINRDLVPAWGRLKAKSIRKREVIALIDTIGERAPITANRTLALVRKIFNFAIDRDLMEGNPAARVKTVVPEKSRERVLSANELKRIWEVLDQVGESVLTTQMAALLKIRLLTAQRHGEVSQMRWQDIREDAWVIPGEFTKNGKLHLVPLTAIARVVINALPRSSDWVFPSTRGGHIKDIYKAINKLKIASGVIDFTPHDFRRTAASSMAQAGVARFDIARVLNHSDNSVTAVYDRYSYEREKRVALQKWENKLLQVVGVRLPSVLNLR